MIITDILNNWIRMLVREYTVKYNVGTVREYCKFCHKLTKGK